MCFHAERDGELTDYERQAGAVIADSGDDLMVGDVIVTRSGCHRIDRIAPLAGRPEARVAFHGDGCWPTALRRDASYRVLPRSRSIVLP